MATGYIFTKTGNSSTKVVHVTNDVVDLGRTKIFKGPVLIEDNDPSLISIKEGGGNAMSLNISAIITIDGSAPAGTMQGVIDQLDAVFPKASTSGGSGGGIAPIIKTADYTLLSSDSGKIIYIDSATDTTVTVPAGLSSGFNCTVVAIGGGTVTLNVDAVTTTGSTSFEITEGNSRVIHEYATNTVHVFGGGGGSSSAPVTIEDKAFTNLTGYSTVAGSASATSDGGTVKLYIPNAGGIIYKDIAGVTLGDLLHFVVKIGTVNSGLLTIAFGDTNGLQNQHTFSAPGTYTFDINTATATTGTRLWLGAGFAYSAGDGFIESILITK